MFELRQTAECNFIGNESKCYKIKIRVFLDMTSFLKEKDSHRDFKRQVHFMEDYRLINVFPNSKKFS